MTRLSRREALRMLAGPGAVAALGTLGRSGAARAGEVPRGGGQVVVGLSEEPTVFNPLRPHIEVDRGVHFGILDSLWRTDERAQFVPNLAVEIPSVKNGGIAKNGLEYTFRLKKGVAWHDGKPFTSRDVKFTWELVTSPKFGAFTKAGFDAAASMETPDESTVRVRLKEPFAPFLTAWGDAWIVPAHLLESVPDPNTVEFNTRSPIGTGPFKFGSRVAGDHLVLVANPDYHGGPPDPEGGIFKDIPHPPALYTQFKTGAIDVAAVPRISP